MQGDNDFIFDTTKYPNASAMVEYFHSLGVRVVFHFPCRSSLNIRFSGQLVWLILILQIMLKDKRYHDKSLGIIITEWILFK